jgi:hypothetical protein
VIFISIGERRLRLSLLRSVSERNGVTQFTAAAEALVLVCGYGWN